MVEVARPQHSGDGTENLLGDEGRSRDRIVDDRRPDEIAARGQILPLKNDVAELGRAVLPAPDPLHRVVVDYRTELGAHSGRRPDRERPRRFHEPLDEQVVHATDRDDPRSGRAALPAEAEHRANSGRNRLVEVGVRVDDDGVLATHLRDHAADFPLAG